MTFKREEMNEELLLRENIRKAIKIVVEKRKAENQKILKEEVKLRGVIRKLITEAAASGGTPATPHRSTGINVLEDVLKTSIPTLRADYKRLTTDKTQRESFRAHIIKAIEDQLKPSLVNDQFPMNQTSPDPTEPGEESGIGGEVGTLEEPPAEGGERFPKTAIMVKPNQTPATEDKAVAESIMNGQEDIFNIFKKVSYDDLKAALEEWLNPSEEGETPETAKKEAVPAGVKKADDIDTAFDDLFNN